MVPVIRVPHPALAPFVQRLWVTASPAATPKGREHSLPLPAMHLVLRLTDEPVRLFDSAHDSRGRAVGVAVVGGVRSTFYIKETPVATISIGVDFHPAASQALFGCGALELAERHEPLTTFWNVSAVSALRDRLLGTIDPAEQFDILEAAIAKRLPRVQGIHPAVALALERFHRTPHVAAVVRESGYSHRTFAEQFRRTIGLRPKAYLRLVRLRRVLERIGTAPWADLAVDAGFSDQAHFVREFRAFTGATPTAYLRARPSNPDHFKILQD